jgi:predicted O-methyltransferase YrrM
VAYAAGNPDMPKVSTDRNTDGVIELNRLLYSSPDWYTTIIPLRDGVSVALRI